MAKSVSQLRRQLGDIEPDENTFRALDASDVEALRALLDDDEGWLAARAVHALARIDAPAARDAIVTAVRSPRLEVRAAVASSARTLPSEVSDTVLATLLDDSAPGVRKFAVRSVGAGNSDAVKSRVSHIASSDAQAALRRVAQDKSRSLS